jgi:glycosyltransferase involved in cell wall biosynthesis
VVGGGADEARLRGLYPEARFLGRVSDEDLAELYPRARALVMPNVEEFGITAVEAQASGRPVIAADDGGARETVIDGETGVLVASGDVGALAEAMTYVDTDRFSSAAAVANARRFSVTAFQRGIARQVELAIAAG